jgi:hypothetical protein
VDVDVFETRVDPSYDHDHDHDHVHDGASYPNGIGPRALHPDESTCASPGSDRPSARSYRCLARTGARDLVERSLHSIQSTRCCARPFDTSGPIDATVLGSLSVHCLDRRDGPRVPIGTLPRSTRRSSGPYRYVASIDATVLGSLSVHCLDRRDGPRVPIGTLPRSDARVLGSLSIRSPDRRIGSSRPPLEAARPTHRVFPTSARGGPTDASGPSVSRARTAARGRDHLPAGRPHRPARELPRDLAAPRPSAPLAAAPSTFLIFPIFLSPFLSPAAEACCALHPCVPWNRGTWGPLDPMPFG